MSSLYVFLLFVAILLVEVLFRFFYRKDVKDLLNRIMAKDYKEYEYYKKKFDKDVKEEENIREEARQERVDFRKDVKSSRELEEFEEIEKDNTTDLKDFEEEVPEVL